MSLVGVTKLIGAVLGYSRGTHIEIGKAYVVPLKETGTVPRMLRSSEDAPFSNAVVF